jgi:hypothetical protein
VVRGALGRSAARPIFLEPRLNVHQKNPNFSLLFRSSFSMRSWHASARLVFYFFFVSVRRRMDFSGDQEKVSRYARERFLFLWAHLRLWRSLGLERSLRPAASPLHPSGCAIAPAMGGVVLRPFHLFRLQPSVGYTPRVVSKRRAEQNRSPHAGTARRRKEWAI